MSRLKKPTALKILAGNPGKKPLPVGEPEFAQTDTAAPNWLTGEAVLQWHSLAAALDVNGMLNTANRELLATYCDLLGNYIEKRRAGGEPDLKIAQQLRLLAREFGLSPSSQAGVCTRGKADGPEEKARFFG